MNICIIGLGLIGGSFALALRKYALTDRLYGVDASPRNAAKALELGLVDELIEWDRVAEAADIIVLATPVDVIPQLAIKLLNRIDDSRIVFDMGSTKEELCEIISQHPRRHRFVAAHPMWGTEHSGPEAAVEDAFVGCNTVLCDVEQSDADAVSAVERIFTTIGMKIMYMSPAQHDTHAAYVSLFRISPPSFWLPRYSRRSARAPLFSTSRVEASRARCDLPNPRPICGYRY